MPAAPETMSQMFDQAVETFGGAMKAGIKFQEDAAKWWTDAFEQVGMVQTWQKRSRAVLNDAIPVMQSSADEYLRLIDQSHRSGMEIMKKAAAACRCESIPDAQAKSQDLMEASFAATKTNAEAAVQANTKVMHSWADIMRKGLDVAQANAQSATQAATRMTEKVEKGK